MGSGLGPQLLIPPTHFTTIHEPLSSWLATVSSSSQMLHPQRLRCRRPDHNSGDRSGFTPPNRTKQDSRTPHVSSNQRRLKDKGTHHHINQSSCPRAQNLAEMRDQTTERNRDPSPTQKKANSIRQKSEKKRSEAYHQHRPRLCCTCTS
jgi:hypothetical protein